MPDEPAERSPAPESGPCALTPGAWDSGHQRRVARGWVFGSGALRKVADLLFALLMMWLVSEKVARKKSRRKNVDGDEGFLTTIWLTGKLREMEKVNRMKHGHWMDSRN